MLLSSTTMPPHPTDETTELLDLTHCPFPSCTARFDTEGLHPRAREIVACIHLWSWHGVPVWPGTWTGRWARL